MAKRWFGLQGGALRCVSLCFAVLVLACTWGAPARADGVRVLSAGAAQGALRPIGEAFTRTSGHTLEAAFDTVGALRRRVLGGEGADVVILSAEAIAALESAGKIDPAALVDLGSVQVALAVRRGTALPDIATGEALKRTLLAARSLAHADPARGATAGTHFAKVLEQLGIAQEVRPRLSVLPFGGDVVDGVADGRFEIGVSQSSEIVAHAGVVLVGGLPNPFAQKTRYLAARTPAAGAAADLLLQALRGAESRAALAAAGFDPPR